MLRTKILEARIVDIEPKTESFSPISFSNGICFELYFGEILGIVGKRNSGKSSIAKSIMGIYNLINGEIWFDGELISKEMPVEKRMFLNRQIQMIFQNPKLSLNPRMRTEEIISEGIINHRLFISKSQIKNRVYELLDEVELSKKFMYKYPKELTPIEIQKVAMARVLALQPKCLIIDNSTSECDISERDKILRLYKRIQGEYEMTYLFMTDDLSCARYIADRILLLDKGKILDLVDIKS